MFNQLHGVISRFPAGVNGVWDLSQRLASDHLRLLTPCALEQVWDGEAIGHELPAGARRPEPKLKMPTQLFCMRWCNLTLGSGGVPGPFKRTPPELKVRLQKLKVRSQKLRGVF